MYDGDWDTGVVGAAGAWACNPVGMYRYGMLYEEAMWCNMEALYGDVNADGKVDIGDVVYLISYLYRNGPGPHPLWIGDCNCGGIVTLGDVVYLISYLYRGGPPPGC